LPWSEIWTDAGNPALLPFSFDCPFNFLSSFGLFSQELTVDKPVISVRQTTKAPVIDGSSSDECWGKAGSSEVEIATKQGGKIKGFLSVQETRRIFISL